MKNDTRGMCLVPVIWQIGNDQIDKGNIKPTFGVLGLSLHRLRDGSLYVCVKDVTWLILGF